MAWEYYQFIGVSPSASAEEVKRACFRKRRELAVKGDRKGQEYLNQVSETLQDPRNRERYDALQKHGDQVAEFVSKAMQAMEREAWPNAIRLLKQAAALVPTDAFVISLLGLCYASKGELAQAVEEFRKLSSVAPEDPDVWYHLGMCLLRLAGTVPNADGLIVCPYCGLEQKPPWSVIRASRKCAECGRVIRVYKKGRRDQLLGDARECFNKAIRLQSYNALFYMGIARTYEVEGRYLEAASWVERAIGADGTTDYRDTEAFCYLGRLFVFANQFEQALSAATRMKQALADNEDAITYGAIWFLLLAQRAFRAGAFSQAAALSEMVLILSPQENKILEAAEACRLVASANLELSSLTNDPSIAQPVVAAAAYFVATKSGVAVKKEKELFKQICESIDSLPASTLSRSLEILRNKYPNAYLCGELFFDKLAKAIESSASGCGCLLALLYIATMALLAMGAIAFGAVKLVVALL